MSGAKWLRGASLSRAWGALAVKIASKAHEGYALEVTVSYFSQKERYPEREGSQVAFSLLASKPKTDQLCDRNLDVQDLPESSVYTVLPVNRTIPTAAVWA